VPGIGIELRPSTRTLGSDIMSSNGTERLWSDDRPIQVTAEERHEMICVAAYYRAERRAFAPGGERRDWLEAEREIDRMLAKMAQNRVSRNAYEGVGLRNALRLWADDETG
jgi:hypothetical protein